MKKSVVFLCSGGSCCKGCKLKQGSRCDLRALVCVRVFVRACVRARSLAVTSMSATPPVGVSSNRKSPFFSRQQMHRVLFVLIFFSPIKDIWKRQQPIDLQATLKYPKWTWTPQHTGPTRRTKIKFHDLSPWAVADKYFYLGMPPIKITDNNIIHNDNSTITNSFYFDVSFTNVLMLYLFLLTWSSRCSTSRTWLFWAQECIALRTVDNLLISPLVLKWVTKMLETALVGMLQTTTVSFSWTFAWRLNSNRLRHRF